MRAYAATFYTRSGIYSVYTGTGITIMLYQKESIIRIITKKETAQLTC